MLSVGVLTYIFIHSSSRNTHLSSWKHARSLYFLLYTTYLRCCSLHLITVTEQRAQVNFLGAYLLSINIRVLENH